MRSDVLSSKRRILWAFGDLEDSSPLILGLEEILFYTALSNNGIRIIKKKINTFHKLKFFNNKDYLNKLKVSNIVISSGGLILFDALLMNKKIICLPQFKHQKKNVEELHKKKAIKYFFHLNKRNILNFFIKIYDNPLYEKKIKLIQKHIINLNKVKRNYSLIGKIYEKSIN